MNGYSNPTDYVGQLEAFRKSDADRDALVAEVIEKYEQLKIAYQEKSDDLSNEVESRRLWQSKASTNERALTELRQSSGSNSFVVVILDGDGAIFNDYLWALGKDGGADAAHILNDEIKKYLRATYPDGLVDDWTIVCHVILNLQGLASKLQRCGIVANPNEVLAFGRAFGAAQPMFSFIDAGAGKERADHKIRETLRLFLPLGQCKHVFFGPCHDSGYVVVLERYKREYASRLTLVETRPAEPGFATLGFNFIKFPSIFRSTDLPARNLSEAAPPPMTTPIRTQANNNASMQPTSAVFVPQSPSPAPSAESGASSSWATVGRSTSANNKSIDIAPKKAAVRKFMLFNVNDERLDEALPKPDGAAQKRFNERLKTQANCCNEYHLSGVCSKGEEYCDYVHGPRITGGELLVLKHKARSLNCPNSHWCQNINCYMGHHCKYGKKCPLPTCYFSDTHHMDFKPAKKTYEDGTEEWLSSFFNEK